MGERVRTLDGVSEVLFGNVTKTAVWDGKNDYGKSVASGVYIYLLEAGDVKKKKGKIAIMR